MSLRWFHMVFLLVVIMGADLFGGWAIHAFRQDGERWMLITGVVSMIGGLGLAAYTVLLVRKLERLHIQ